MTTPMCRRIAQELRQQIKSGHPGPGEQLPTELELGERYEASGNSGRDAIMRAPNPPGPWRGRVILLRCTDPTHPSIQVIPTFGTFWAHVPRGAQAGPADRRA